MRFDIDGCDYLKPEERIGKVVGIYKVIGIDRESKGGNRIYKCKCTFCGLETIRSFAEMNRVSKCTHENKIGEYKDFTLKSLRVWFVDAIQKQIETINGMEQKVSKYMKNGCEIQLCLKNGLYITDTPMI